jgi:hypothetical protein
MGSVVLVAIDVEVAASGSKLELTAGVMVRIESMDFWGSLGFFK